MSFFVILVYLLIKNHKLSNVLLGIALIKNITLIIAVTIGEITFPTHGVTIDFGMIFVYSLIIIISSLLFIFYCLRLKIINESEMKCGSQ